MRTSIGFFENLQNLHYAFLTLCTLVFATTATLDEVRLGDPSLRGFVHAGVVGLVMTVMHTKPHNTTAIAFSTFGMALGARVAWFYGAHGLATALVVSAVEVLRRHDTFVVTPTGLTLAVGLAASAPRLDRLAETLAFVAHSAFVCSVVDEYDAIHGLVAATLALHSIDSPAALLFASACARAACTVVRRCCAMGERGLASAPDADEVDGVHEAQTCFEGSRWYFVACALHVGMLTADAWSCCDVDAVETSTRMVHVAALASTLLYVIPAARETFPWMRWALCSFPLFDALLCGYRIAEGAPVVVLGLRGLAALCEAAALHIPAVERDVRATRASRSSRSATIDRAAIGVYAIVHVVHAVSQNGFATSLAIVFHYVVVTLSLAKIGIEDREWVSARIARAFLVIECGTNLALLALLDHDRETLAANAASAAFLGWRVHAARHQASLLFDVTWLTLNVIERSPGSVPAPV
jgi:hypothetical protein